MAESAKASKAKQVTADRSSEPPRRQLAGPANGIIALQRAAGNQAVSGHVQQVLRASGQPLDSATQNHMEQAFQHDFSQVRLHADRQAAESATAAQAKAYTVGRDVVFGEGRYAPETSTGEQLLAHELTHVVQQSRGGAPPSIHRHSPQEQEADTVTGDIVNGTEAVAVTGASGVGIARAEDDQLPWWKRQLNPLYQKALEKLPPSAVKRLEELNKGAKAFVEMHGVKDEQIDASVRAAQPLLNPAREMLGLPPEKDTGNDTQIPPNPSKVVWLGQPPLDVRLSKQAEQRKRDKEAKRDNPQGLGVPEPRSGAAGTQDIPSGDMFAPEPDPTLFEQQLKSGKMFSHKFIPAKPDIDPSQAVWLGSGRPPTVGQLSRMQLLPADNLSPSMKVAVPTDDKIEVGISGQTVMPIRDQKTGALKGYRYRRGDTVYEWDRNGNMTSLIGDEKPLEEPAIDPIDAAMLIADIGPLIAKGVTAGGKALARRAGKTALRGTTEAATEEVSAIATKKGSLQIGSEAIDAAKLEAQAVKEAPVIRYEGGEISLIVDDSVPANVVGRKPRGFDTGRAGPGRNVKSGTLEDFEPTSFDRARTPRNRSVTRAQQLEGIDPAKRADPNPFMNDALKSASDPKHPLYKLVTPDDAGAVDWHKTERVTKTGKVQKGRYQGSETDPIVQAGHKDAHAARGKQEFMLEDADANQLSGQQIESKGGYSFKERVFVTKPDGSGGVWVERTSLEQWEQLGVVPKGTVDFALKHPNTIADLPK